MKCARPPEDSLALLRRLRRLRLEVFEDCAAIVMKQINARPDLAR